MANVKLELDTRYTRKDSFYPIRLVVSAHGKRFYIPTGQATSLDIFQTHGGKNGRTWLKNKPLSTANAILNDFLQKAHECLPIILQPNYAGMTAGQLREIMQNLMDSHGHGERGLLETLQEYAELKTGLTKKTFLYTAKEVHKYHPADISLQYINRNWLEKFYAKERERIGHNTVIMHLSRIRTVFNYALDNEYTVNNPFRRFRLSRANTAKRSLTVEQLATIAKTKCSKAGEEARDMFLLSFYLIGVNPVDLFQLTPENLMKGRLIFNRHKTKKLYNIKIMPEALQLLEKYKGKKYLLDGAEVSGWENFYRRIYVNLHRHFCKIEPHISMYWARHTWATLAAQLDVPDGTISAALGHRTMNPVTAIYVNFDQKKVDNANRTVLDYLAKFL